MKIILLITLQLLLFSCFKDKNCKHLPSGKYKLVYDNYGYYSFNINITSNKTNLIIDKNNINKFGCNINGYFKKRKINGNISKLKHKKYMIEGTYEENVYYAGQIYHYTGNFFISNE